jgi:tetratricopeptide (TPR) repeat protein|tara:strand:+ start:210 stop:1445 length:1236 start_codon:yes stop_codon:yes gene_type:complete
MNKDIDLISELFTKAIKNCQENNFQIAVELYKKIILISPNHINAHYNLGILYQKLRDYQKAINCFEKVIEVNPHKIEAYNNQGIAYTELREYQKAINCFEKAIEINPNFALAYNNIATNFLKIKNFEKYYINTVKYLDLKSIKTISNSELKNIIPKFAKKLQNQNGIRTFFDNEVLSHLTEEKKPISDFCEIFEKSQISKKNRFLSYLERTKSLSELNTTNRLFQGLPLTTSQGIHSLIKWKDTPLYKSTFDLTIYQMIIQEVKPDIIIELGSGEGGSAIWLADTAAALGLDTHVYSFDLKKPLVTHDKVTFIEFDLNKISSYNLLPYWDLFTQKKIIIEDAHVNLKSILDLVDAILKKDDYLVIEDSDLKQNIIYHFTKEKEHKYKLDQFFLDFFGTNITSCFNSIFKCH